MESHGALVTLLELSRHLGIKPNWLRSEADAGRIPCLNAGGKRIFNLDAVIRTLAERAALPLKDRTKDARS